MNPLGTDDRIMAAADILESRISFVPPDDSWGQPNLVNPMGWDPASPKDEALDRVHPLMRAIANDDPRHSDAHRLALIRRYAKELADTILGGAE